MALLLVLISAVILIFVLHELALRQKTAASKRVPEEIVSFVDSSLKAYPDRIHHKDRSVDHRWTCHSRLFTFQIRLENLGGAHYRFTIAFFRELPFRFSLNPGKGSCKKGAEEIKMDKEMKEKTLKLIPTSLSHLPIPFVTRVHHKDQEIRGINDSAKRLLSEKEIPGLLDKLLFYDTIRVTRNGVHGSKSFQELVDLEEWPKTLGASITFVRFLLNYQDRKELTQKTGALCPYCRNAISGNENAVSCGDCRTVHHLDCWNETDRCSVFGCGNKSEIQL